MNFNWDDYLFLAQELATPTNLPNQEARLRSAISRAYYSAFCKARNFLRDEQRVQIPLTGEAHRLVWMHFKSRSGKTYKKIGENLRRLLNDRRCADYDDVIRDLPILANKALWRAQDIVSTLDRL